MLEVDRKVEVNGGAGLEWALVCCQMRLGNLTFRIDPKSSHFCHFYCYTLNQAAIISSFCCAFLTDLLVSIFVSLWPILHGIHSGL